MIILRGFPPLHPKTVCPEIQKQVRRIDQAMKAPSEVDLLAIIDRWVSIVVPNCNQFVSSFDSTYTIRFNGIKVTIAVMGEKGCGKSAAIMKGLKAYKLAEPVTITDCPEDDFLLQCGCAVLSPRNM